MTKVRSISLIAFVLLANISFFSTSWAVEQTVTDNYTQTRYPIVLIHGYLGSSTILGSDYFFRIKRELERGGATVYAPAVPAVNSTEVRTQILLELLYKLQGRHGYQKFNLIGHSHGGLVARQIAGVAPELVASVTTVGTPNDGAFISDYELKTRNIGQFDKLYEALGYFSNLFDGAVFPQDKLAFLNSTSTQGVREFNRQFPLALPDSACGQGPEYAGGIFHYSYSGNAVVTNLFDPSDAVLLKQTRIASAYLRSDSSDGWIGRCSTHYGRVVRDDLRWNHLDEINQLFGAKGLYAESPVAVYRNHANRLKNHGL